MPFFDFQDKLIHYQLDGNQTKPVLVLLNGIMMSTASWEVFVKPLVQHFYLVRIDMLDQGKSSKMDTPYTQSLQVKMIESLFAHLNLKNIYLAGISYGGSIALQYASSHPERLKKMIVFNAVSKTSPWLKAIGDGWNAVAETRSGNAYYHITIPFIYSPKFYTNNIAWMEQRKAMLIPLFSNPVFLDAMIRLTQSAETHNVDQALPNIHVPTLVVASEHDYLTPVFEQQYIVQTMPNAHIVEFKDCGHASMYEKPELFVQTLIGYFIAESHNYKI